MTCGKNTQDGRVVAWDSLENRCTGNRIEGATCSLSQIFEEQLFSHVITV
jgi:hypothetical protein